MEELIALLKDQLYKKAYELGQKVREFEQKQVLHGNVEAKQLWIQFYEDNLKYADLLDDAFKDGYFALPEKEREK